jgi:DNA modification methylase
MYNLEVNEEFKKLIPPLSKEEYEQLETNCLNEGIREAILTWNGVIIDGHNRYEIAKRWNLDFQTKSKNFKDENAVREWMILNQFGRRNLSNYQRSVLALQLEKVFSERAKEQQGKRADLLVNSPKSEPIDTRKELAKIASVGEQTIARVKVIEAKANEETKAKLSTGEVSINQVYQEIKKDEKKIQLEVKKKEYTEQSKSEIQSNIEITLTDSVTYLNSFEDNTIDLLITDPPYATDIEDIYSFTKEWIEVALQKVKKGGRAYICSGAYPNEIQAFLSVLMSQNKFIVDNPLIWTYRNTLGITPKMKYNLNYQLVWHLYSNESNELDTSITNEMFSVQDINAPDGRIGNRLHTWQKPDELANRLIKHGSKEGDLVVDCFACTGTFLIAASKFNRTAKGCDISQENLNIAKQRGCTIIG